MIKKLAINKSKKHEEQLKCLFDYYCNSLTLCLFDIKNLKEMIV